jgi:two-component system, OmpR family, phosphate regulon sensor histidine kinase PhoR
MLPRLLSAALASGVGAALGGAVGAGFGLTASGAVAGAAAALAGWLAHDAWQARRLLAWLRHAEGAPPALPGEWGEIGYRVDRQLRERAQREAAGQARLAQFLAAIDASPNGVLLLDADDGIDWCNRVAADHLGIDPQRDLGQRLTHLVRLPAFVAYLQQRPPGGPVTIASPDGRGSLLVQARAFGDNQTLLLTQDVTERERADAMRRDFVANVSHEIRTPLTVLAGFVETMQSLPLTEVERRRVLQLMGQQTDRMQLLVSDLLTLAKLEGSPRPPSDHWVPLAKLLQQAEGDARTLSAGRHWIEVSVPDDVEIAGSEVELQSAIGNLLGNAVRYTPDEGRIDLRWIDRADGGCVEVRDTGIGVAREHVARLTERFYRVDGSRARETGGTGLGLSIVKHVMQRHGGQIEIDSEPGKGSRFRLVFPAARLRRGGAPAPVTAARAATLP